jgi:hypothetical protein
MGESRDRKRPENEALRRTVLCCGFRRPGPFEVSLPFYAFEDLLPTSAPYRQVTHLLDPKPISLSTRPLTPLQKRPIGLLSTVGIIRRTDRPVCSVREDTLRTLLNNPRHKPGQSTYIWAFQIATEPL